MTSTYTRERTLQETIAPAVEGRLPEVEVLAVELVSPSRFCVYIDHPSGVDHALCERVTHLLDEYRADFSIDVSSPGPSDRSGSSPTSPPSSDGGSQSAPTATPSGESASVARWSRPETTP